MKKYLIILAVAGFIVDGKKRLLIVKKSDHERIDAGLWTVPGGKVKPEEPIINALKREVKEEVGLEINNYQWINEDVFRHENIFFHAHHFLCRVKKINKINLEKSLLNYRWITKKDINQYQFPVNIKKEIVNIFRILEIPNESF